LSRGDFEGRYRIERELGAGGYATAYLAVPARHRVGAVRGRVWRDPLSYGVGSK